MEANHTRRANNVAKFSTEQVLGFMTTEHVDRQTLERAKNSVTENAGMITTDDRRSERRRRRGRRGGLHGGTNIGEGRGESGADEFDEAFRASNLKERDERSGRVPWSAGKMGEEFHVIKDRGKPGGRTGGNKWGEESRQHVNKGRRRFDSQPREAREPGNTNEIVRHDKGKALHKNGVGE